MWTLKNKPNVIKVSKELAKEFAEMDPAPHDRPLSERRLQVYQRILEGGGFRPCTWARAYCKETGGVYRVNGKHTSVMLSGLEKTPVFYACIEDYNCETLEDVAKLYATFDSRMQSRTVGDINASFAGTIPELRELHIRIVNVAVAGMAYHTWADKDLYNRTPAAERAELLLEHPEFVVWLNDLQQNGKYEEQGKALNNHFRCPHIIRQGVVAAMFGSWQKDKEDALAFWSAVRDETGEKPELPDRKLSRYLITLRQKSRTSSTLRETYVRSIHAWNAWRNETSTNLRYVPNADVPAIQ